LYWVLTRRPWCLAQKETSAHAQTWLAFLQHTPCHRFLHQPVKQVSFT
jgi:hypothetical protein